MNKKYLIFGTKNIGKEDFRLIRFFYLPIIEKEAYILFNYFYDFEFFNEKKEFLNLNDLESIFKMDQVVFEKNKKILEAIGLIRTFYNEEKKVVLIELKKPSTINQILKNHYFSELLIKKIGQNKFNELIERLSEKDYKKEGFSEVSTNFFQIFISDDVKDEVHINDIKSNIEAKQVLNSKRYIEYLTHRLPIPSLEKKVEHYHQLGFSFHALNEILDYCYKINNKINFQYFEKIAKDLFNKKIILHHEVYQELLEKFEYKQKINSKSKPLFDPNETLQNDTEEINNTNVIDDFLKEVEETEW
ncbi:DnaD domain protein [Mesomycoplasma hyorhinis]|uniref:DnaD domain protein n=1 Tax=Mesomycoplasma hyorhinis TaxID=2100 RepID=UPI001C05EA48|nr:DnaD domain protein [Mesomycoplasma hyorhinis]